MVMAVPRTFYIFHGKIRHGNSVAENSGANLRVTISAYVLLKCEICMQH